MRVPTVKVKVLSEPDDSGHLIINEQDFDPAKHAPYDEWLINFVKSGGKKESIPPEGGEIERPKGNQLAGYGGLPNTEQMAEKTEMAKAPRGRPKK